MPHRTPLDLRPQLPGAAPHLPHGSIPTEANQPALPASWQSVSESRYPSPELLPVPGHSQPQEIHKPAKKHAQISSSRLTPPYQLRSDSSNTQCLNLVSPIFCTSFSQEN